MRIVIATGIYPPEIGGPARYAEGVKISLEKAGHQAPVVLFGSLRAWPTGVRHLLYTAKLWYAARGCEAIFAFDTYSVGIPAALVGRLRRVPVVVRVGGDFLWESYVERTQTLLPLPLFYQQLPKDFSFKERIVFYSMRWMMLRVELAFNTQWLLDIWQPVYGFSRERAQVVANVIEDHLSPGTSDGTLLLYGRSIALKNAPAFRRAFTRARKRGLPLSLEERVVSHQAFIDRVRQAHAVAVPSVSDVAPNTIIDAIRCGKPFLLTKYSGYAEIFRDFGIIVDPLDEEDMARGMEALADPKKYASLCAASSNFQDTRTYDEVAEEFLQIAGYRSDTIIRVLQIGSDRSARGILFPGSPGYQRQEAYARSFGHLDIIALSLEKDGARESISGDVHVYPTGSRTKARYFFDALHKANRLRRPNVVSVQDPFEIGLIGWWVARRRRIPLHVQVHTDFLSPAYTRLSVFNRIRVFIAGFVVRRAARIRVVSGRIKHSLESTYHPKAPISILPIYIDVEKFRTAEPITNFTDDRITNSKYKILLVSRNAPEKNIPLAVEAFKQVAPQDACLILIGDVDSNYLGERIYGIGRADPERFYKSADLVLVPSLYEGYGLVIVEALAAGKPVLSTDVGIAREAGAIITDPEHFSDALADWFKNGPHEGVLAAYPYRTFEQYVQAYSDDIKACIEAKKGE